MAERLTRPAGLRFRPNEHRTLLLIGDLVVSALAVGGAVLSWLGYSWIGHISRGIKPMTALNIITNNISVPFWFYLLPLIWVALLIELYDSHVAANRRRTLRGIAVAAFVGFVLYSLVFITIRDPQELPRIGVGAFLLLASLLTLAWRLRYIRIYTSSGLMRRILVIGAGKAGRTLARVFQKMDPPPFHFVGFIDDDRDKLGKDFEGFPVFGNSEHMLQVIEEQRISDVVIGIMGVMRGITFQRILDAQEEGAEIIPMPTLYEEMTGRVPIHHLESDWVLRSFLDEARSGVFYEIGKRLLDILGGLVGLLILLVIFPLIALAIVLDSGWPVFYWQERLGRGGREFKIVKFRTMRQDAEKEGKAQMAGKHDARITRVGNFLRVTRLDEFPQFWNVLRGEMSLVGPRAERAQWVATFQQEIPFYRARLLVKPGLSGWAQINYGYAETVEDTSVKLEYDLYYIKHRSLIMDIIIILRTVGTALGGKGR